MRDLLPKGDDIRRAVKWVSESIQDNPDEPVGRFVQEATFKFDLSPRDSDFLIEFFSKHGKEK